MYLTLIIRAIIIYVLLLVFLRLMGKRTLGELQPFELVITMVIANLACAPISDTEISIWIGIIPVIILFLLHLGGVLLSGKSIYLRRLMNGRPIVIINNDGIICENVKKAHLNMNDLMSGLRQSGYFSPMDIEYAVLETNGTISVLPKIQRKTTTLPYMLICEGKLMPRNIQLANTTRENVYNTLKKYNLNTKDVVIYLWDKQNREYIQPYNQNAILISKNKNKKTD